MQQHLHKKIFYQLLLSGLLLPTNYLSAGTLDIIKGGIDATAGKAGFKQKQFVPAWINYVDGFVVILSALFMIFIIYGGWLWMTARGNEQQVEKAKKLIISAFIGIGIIIGGRIIMELIIFNIS